MSLYNMDTFIAPIGVGTDHVKVWLQEEARSSFTLWIIHSEKPSCNPDGTLRYDLPEIAKKLSEELEAVYPRMIIKFKTIDDAFALDPLMDAIDEIITEEESENPEPRQNTVINITGGTNVMAAASMNAAIVNQIRAQYVKESSSEELNDVKCVVDIPVPSRIEAILNQNQLKVLQTIAKSEYSIDNTPRGMDIPIIKGTITQLALLKELEWNNKIKGENGKTRLTAILGKLVEEKLIISKKTEYYVYKPGKKLPDDSVLDNTQKKPVVKYVLSKSEQRETFVCDLPLKIEESGKEKLLEITALGLRRSKDKWKKNR